MSKKLEEYVVTIPDFPEPGIMFRDITSVIQDPDGLKLAVDGLANLLKDTEFDLIVGPESRGFIFGVPVAYLTGKGFIPVRKKGKLPRQTVSQKYDLEYGQAEVEIHVDAIKPGQKVVIVDDLIATGGSAEAAVKLVEKLGGQVVKMIFVMELAGLKNSELILWPKHLDKCFGHFLLHEKLYMCRKTVRRKSSDGFVCGYQYSFFILNYSQCPASN